MGRGEKSPALLQVYLSTKVDKKIYFNLVFSEFYISDVFHSVVFQK